ncbi:MAG: N-acetylglucosamine-6-phosphate deacetylase [Acidobacteriaceae bacterium]
MLTVLTADRLLTPFRIIESPLILIEDGRISEVTSQSAATIPPTAQHLDYRGHMLAPAYFDVHIHGAIGHDVMEGSRESLEAVGSFIASRGVANFLATTVTAPMDATLQALNNIADIIESSNAIRGAKPLGIHLEGPFVSHAKRGVHPPEFLVEPSIKLFDRFWQAARGHIRLMTIAPELPHALEVIEHATKLGVRVSLGHSNATALETLAGIHAGAHSATHTFNAMRALDHREPGILGTVLDRDDLFAEIICDGIHVTPEMVRLFLKAKGPERGILVTDSMSATGMPDGTYMLGTFEVQVANGRALSHGILAGSILTMDLAVRNLVAFTDASWQVATRMASQNPAHMLGLDKRCGEVAVGRDADINVLTKDGIVTATLLRGKQHTI